MKTTSAARPFCGLLILVFLFSNPLIWARTIGPDSFGYTATDQVPYSFQDISSTGTRVLAGADDSSITATIGFDFVLSGTTNSQAGISANGYIYMGGYVNVWQQDLQFFQSGTDAVYYQTTGTPGNRQFIVQWNRVGIYSSSPSTVTFQAILSEGSGQILFQYQDTTAGNGSDHGAYASIGISGLTWSLFSQGTISNGIAILFSKNAPIITDQPVNQIVNLGETAIFSVGATSPTNMTFQWQKNGTNLSDGVRINGAATTSLTISNVAYSDLGDYSVVVSNFYGPVSSAAARLDVLGPPIILGQPENQMLTNGQTAVFRVVASGTQPMQYRWRRNGVDLNDGYFHLYEDYSYISGSFSSELRILNAAPFEAGEYSVALMNADGTLVSSNAVLRVVFPPSISGLYDQYAYEGYDISFNPYVSGASPLHCQWQFNGVEIPHATNQALTLIDVSQDNQGYYSLAVTNVDGAITSAPVYLSVYQTAPTILSVSESMSVFAGGFSTLSVEARGSKPLTYQWQKNSYNLTGKTNASLRLSNVSKNNGLYRVIVSNPLGVVASENISFTVTNDVPQFTVRAGNYTGLFYDINGHYDNIQGYFGPIVQHGNSGSFSLRISVNGMFSGKLLLDGDQVPFSGRFTTGGIATTQVSRARFKKDTLTVFFDLSLENGPDYRQITGSVTSPTWTTNIASDFYASVQGARAAFSAANPTTSKGNYTMSLDSSSTVPGYGNFCVRIRNNGSLTMFGNLADGTPISQSVQISGLGWPLYAPLYYVKGAHGGRIRNGSVLGWINIDPSLGPVVSGAVNWRKGTNIADKFYPEGFDFQITAFGSPYIPPATGTPVINLAAGTATFDQGNLDETLFRSATLDQNNRFVILGIENNTRIDLRNGTVSGSFTPPGKSRTNFKGIINQQANSFFGHFLGTNISGAFTILPNQ